MEGIKNSIQFKFESKTEKKTIFEERVEEI
jgi:hypothetical protein